jgi:hypothetical protein
MPELCAEQITQLQHAGRLDHEPTPERANEAQSYGQLMFAAALAEAEALDAEGNEAECLMAARRAKQMLELGLMDRPPAARDNQDIDETGTPVIMQGLQQRKGFTQDEHHHVKRRAERRRNIPRGGPAFLPVYSTTGLPRTPLLAQPSIVAPYNPPPLNNPSEGVMQSNQSFPLNGGLGNNPADRDAYVRYHLNN